MTRAVFVFRFFMIAALLAAVFAPAARADSGVPYIHSARELYRITGSSPVPVVLQFDARWCGYCKALAPAMRSLYEQQGQRGIAVYRVDFDENPDIVQDFGVRSLPTIFFIRDNTARDVNVGVLQPQQLFDWVEEAKRK
jgi:thioredoxin-like negative regulator of GroEL